MMIYEDLYLCFLLLYVLLLYYQDPSWDVADRMTTPVTQKSFLRNCHLLPRTSPTAICCICWGEGDHGWPWVTLGDLYRRLAVDTFVKKKDSRKRERRSRVRRANLCRSSMMSTSLWSVKQELQKTYMNMSYLGLFVYVCLLHTWSVHACVHACIHVHTYTCYIMRIKKSWPLQPAAAAGLWSQEKLQEVWPLGVPAFAIFICSEPKKENEICNEDLQVPHRDWNHKPLTVV